MRLESTVPMHPQPRPFTVQLFLDFCAIFSPNGPSMFLVSTIHQESGCVPVPSLLLTLHVAATHSICSCNALYIWLQHILYMAATHTLNIWLQHTQYMAATHSIYGCNTFYIWLQHTLYMTCLTCRCIISAGVALRSARHVEFAGNNFKKGVGILCRPVEPRKLDVLV